MFAGGPVSPRYFNTVFHPMAESANQRASASANEWSSNGTVTLWDRVHGSAAKKSLVLPGPCSIFSAPPWRVEWAEASNRNLPSPRTKAPRPRSRLKQTTAGPPVSLLLPPPADFSGSRSGSLGSLNDEMHPLSEPVSPDPCSRKCVRPASCSARCRSRCARFHISACGFLPGC
jgi:hypothetical protein